MDGHGCRYQRARLQLPINTPVALTVRPGRETDALLPWLRRELRVLLAVDDVDTVMWYALGVCERAGIPAPAAHPPAPGRPLPERAAWLVRSLPHLPACPPVRPSACGLCAAHAISLCRRLETALGLHASTAAPRAVARVSSSCLCRAAVAVPRRAPSHALPHCGASWGGGERAFPHFLRPF
jgi:hypothetical protein